MRDPKLATISQLQSYRLSPLLEDPAIASRVADIITAPLSREKLQQTLSISLVEPTGGGKKNATLDELTFRVPITDPLLPGDAIVLTIGA